MNIKQLIPALQHPNPKIRLASACILGMVEDVRALPLLQQCIPQENDPQTRRAMQWSLSRMQAVKAEGFDTIEHVLNFFGIYKEINSTEDPQEERALKQIQLKMETDFQQEMIDSQNQRMFNAATATMIGGVTAGVTSIMGSSMNISSSLGSAARRMEKANKRTPAMRPTTDDITIWLKRLRSENPQQREQAAVQLNVLYNLDALPHMAEVFVREPEQKVKEAIERCGKLMYWRGLYWDMEESGFIERFVEKKLEEKFGKKKNETAPNSVPPFHVEGEEKAKVQPQPQSEEEIADILRKAELSRRKRKK